MTRGRSRSARSSAIGRWRLIRDSPTFTVTPAVRLRHDRGRLRGCVGPSTGLDLRPGCYPPSVEAPVPNMTATLVLGLSTHTQIAHCYGLYWALADHAERGDLDADGCRRPGPRATASLKIERRVSGIATSR